MSEARVILVTGAGGGLGRAICERFHAAGDTVVATDLAATSLADLTGRPRILTTGLDVTDAESVRAAAAQVRQQLGRLDVLVNNAGVVGYFPVAEIDPETLIRHFQINAFGALRLTHACLDLLADGGGRVVNITSESYRLRTPFQIYQSTKLALEGISDVLRRELAPLGVHVATVRPGAIDTPLFHAMDAIENPVPDGRLAVPFERFAARLARNPPKRRSAPGEVAEVVYRAATGRRRRAHYEINNMRALKLASRLPAGWVDRLVGRLLR